MELESGIYVTKCYGERPVVVIGKGVMLIGSEWAFSLQSFFEVNEIVERVRVLEITFKVPIDTNTKFEDSLNTLYKNIESSDIKIMFTAQVNDDTHKTRVIRFEDMGFYLDEKIVKCGAYLGEVDSFQYHSFERVE